VSGTAISGAHYLPLENPVVIPDGSTSVNVDVIPFQDAILEPDQTVIVTLPTNANYNVSSSAAATVVITDDGTSQIPGVGFCFASSAVLENESPGIAVQLSMTSSVPVQVDYRVIGGTAPANRYSLPPGTLTIPSNSWVAFIPLQVIDDGIVEPPQTIKVVLFNPTNATLDAIKVHTYTILDDDTCSVSVTATITNATEAGMVPGNFRISRIGSTNAAQLVYFQITGSASAPTDYMPLGNVATIPAGAASVDLPVKPVNGSTEELPRSVVLTLTSATNASIISPNVATVTIITDNTNNLPVVAVSSTNQPYAVAGGKNGGFLFTRTGATNSALTVSFTTGGTAGPGVRYLSFTNAVTIPAGQTSVTLPVVAIDDHLVEGDQTVTVTLTEPETYRTLFPSSATVTVQDGDQSVWIDASDFAASKYGLDPGQFTFSRFGTTNTPATIDYTISGTASNGLDYVHITNSIVIPAGQLTVTLPILPLHNGIVEGPVTVTLTLLSNTAYSLGAPTSGTVTINDDMPMLTISAIVTNVLEGSGSNGVFRVTRTGDPKYDFTAYLGVAGTAVFGTDYPPFPTNIYFTCGMTSIDLYVTPTNEGVVPNDKTVTAALLPNPAYTILWPSNASLTIAGSGTNQTPQVIITNPAGQVVFMDLNSAGEAGLVLNAVILDLVPTNDVLTWSEVSGPGSYAFGDPTTNNTTVVFTNSGIYQLRLTADNGQFQGYADLLVYVGTDVLSETNILHWTLDDGSGTNVTDNSSYGRDGTLYGPADWTTNGIIAGALDFQGTNDCVRQSAGSNTLDGLNAFTVTLWLKSTTNNATEGFLTGDDVDTNATLNFATRTFASCGNETNVIEAVVATTQGTVTRSSVSDAVNSGLWQHVAVTWTNGEAPKLYLNGLLDQPAAGFVGVSGGLTNCPQFIIGKGDWANPASWKGGMDDVRVFNQALSPDEILQLAEDPVANRAPVVYAGTNVTVQVGIPVNLTGMVSDDGLPNPPGTVTYSWSFLGTNDLTIPNPLSLTNTFTFSDPGDYIFRLTATDGEFTSFSDVTVTVIPPTEVSIYADISDAYDLGPVPGDFTLTRVGDTNDALTVYFTVSGTSSNGVDYVSITNFATFPPQSNSIALPVTPILNYAIKGDESVIVTLLTNIAYSVLDGQSTATVIVHDSPYGMWSIQNFTLEQLTHPELSGPGADFSHDGIVNFAEYAFDLDPKAVNANPPYTWDFETSTDDNLQHLTFTYTRRLPPRDVQYGVYVSTDLVNWYTGTNYVEEFLATNNPDGITETVKARALMPFPGLTNLFMNIRVWLEQVPAPSP
jgi:hypothetical protein